MASRGATKYLGPHPKEIIGDVRREDFDDDFVFGSATSSYQIEGGINEGGKGPSTWDYWTSNYPDRIEDGKSGDVAINHYYQFKEDVKLMKKTGMEAYRFSISWPRILPGGKLSSGISKQGIKFYNDLIDALVEEGIEPHVTLFHWDLPLALEFEYGGFLSRDIVKDFCDYAELCFWEFGDRVKNWITFNEGWTYCSMGYVSGTFPPGRGHTDPDALRHTICRHKGGGAGHAVCSKGNPGVDPYIAAHNMILAHAYCVDLYRKQFQDNQGGKIGITNVSHFFEPMEDTELDRNACNRAIDWMFGWFTAPIATGDYPPSMRKAVKERLIIFTAEEANLVRDSYDFLGINYYTTWYATHTNRLPGDPPSYTTDQELTTHYSRGDDFIGDPTGADWLFIVPRGIYNLLVHAKEKYGIKRIHITENGCADKDGTRDDKTPHLSLDKGRQDPVRVRYYREHLWFLKKAIREANVNVKAYFLWSFADNYEWADGYTYRFGIFYVDFDNGLYTRYPKSSAMFWRNFFNKKITAGTQKREAKDNGGDRKRARASAV